ncbi:Fc.00g036360.m01.CDS01 [Cosmosporella sp. VM-42]
MLQKFRYEQCDSNSLVCVKDGFLRQATVTTNIVFILVFVLTNGTLKGFFRLAHPNAIDTMTFTPEELPPGTPPAFQDLTGDGQVWVPKYSHACTFGPGEFTTTMMNLVKNPNLNSNWLFRADIIYDDHPDSLEAQDNQIFPLGTTRDIQYYVPQRTLVRTLIPRNPRRDAPLNQTCCFYRSSSTETGHESSLLIYTPHATCSQDLPFYHPKVGGIAHLQEWDASTENGTISVYFLPFPGESVDDQKLQRVAYHLLEILNKHGHSNAAGYVKRVHHDIVVPQHVFQDRYSELKNKYASELIDTWAETTDPRKHVFEDLGIASFLIELWKDMYKDTEFPGFVDIGCGNGLLVYILLQEGYNGWGFDARARKSWVKYKIPSSSSPSGNSLEKLLLLPSVVPRGIENGVVSPDDIQNGIFPQGTFIVSNHADELTPWTPILATISECPFIMIPCCSHNLTGERWRAPPPRDKSKGRSAFASLVDWATRIAEDCGWEVETEMLRIPSTRNTCLLGRGRTSKASDIEIDTILQKYGGVGGYCDNVAKLLKTNPRGH